MNTGTLNTGDLGGKPKVNKLLLGFYFLAWYVLNVGYNIYVKRTLNVLPLPFTFAVIQLGAGAVWLLPQFLIGIRKVPKPSPSNVKALTQVAAFHGAGQLATVVAMGLGCAPARPRATLAIPTPRTERIGFESARSRQSPDANLTGTSGSTRSLRAPSPPARPS